MPNPLSYHKKFDELTENEKRLLTINKKSISDFVEQSSSVSDVNYATRNVHAKTYAVVKGEFIISDHIPDYLMSIFEEKKFDLTIRISNANLKINKTQKDFPAYGFSVKIKDENNCLIANYPLVNFPLFPINSVSTFLKLFTSINQIFSKGWKNLVVLIVQILKAVPSVFTVSFLKNIIKFLKKRNDFILSFDYYSVGVYRLGEYMMKIKLSPKYVDKNFGKEIKAEKAIESYFTENEYIADVFIQMCYNLKDQPINKLNVEWKNSSYIKIGEVKIEKNSLLNPHECENEMLSFNPFESKAVFQPVGKIQKLRDEAYKVSFQTRQKINKLLKYK